MDITRTVETSTDVEKVFAYLSDFTTTNEWDPGTVETTRISGDGDVGTRYHNISSFLGRKTDLEYTVRTLVPSSRLVLVGNNKTVQATDTMTFTATGSGGTKVVYHAEFEFKGLVARLAPVLSPLLGLAFKKLGDDAEKGMKSALDRL